MHLYKKGNKVYLQLVGVPQSGIASSELNLYLHYYEFKVVNIEYVIYRYNIDDLICLITDINCLNTKFEQYPTSLELIENKINCNGTNLLYLTIDINVFNKLSIDLYDKRSSYTFKINRIQRYSSLLHNSVFRNIINSLLEKENLY